MRITLEGERGRQPRAGVAQCRIEQIEVAKPSTQHHADALGQRIRRLRSLRFAGGS